MAKDQGPEKGKRDLQEMLEALDLRMAAIETMLKESLQRGARGPRSTRAMTKDDAEKIMVGELKDKSIKECAGTLGLSYGQVYSARNGYTFKEYYAQRKENQKNEKKDE